MEMRSVATVLANLLEMHEINYREDHWIFIQIFWNSVRSQQKCQRMDYKKGKCTIEVDIQVTCASYQINILKKYRYIYSQENRW
jgi:hypothetical protein